MNTGESENDRRLPSVASVPSSAAAVHREVPAESDVAAGLVVVLVSCCRCGTTHASASTSDNADRDATMLYNNSGLSTDDVAV